VKKRAAGKKKVNAPARDWRSEEEEEKCFGFCWPAAECGESHTSRVYFIFLFYFSSFHLTREFRQK
jgi:hypothetical protein